jgi:Flp pilus assembly protein TadG
MVEFVIVLPLMLFLIFMIVYAGIGFERYSRVTNAARVAARAAAVARFDGMDQCVAAQEAANAAMDGLAVSMDLCDPGSPGETVTVRLSYTLPDIPLIGSITGPVTVHGKAVERVE